MTGMLGDVASVAASIARATGRAVPEYWVVRRRPPSTKPHIIPPPHRIIPPPSLQPGIVSAILTMPLEPRAAAYVAIPTSGVIRWDTAAVSSAVQASVSQVRAC